MLVQIIGRGRGINRTEVDPLAVLAFTDVVLPLPLASVSNDDGLRVSPGDMMLAAAGAELGSPVDAAKAFPQLFDDAKAAEWALGKASDFPRVLLLETIIGETGGNQQPVQVRYKPHGRGQQWRTAHVLPDRLDGFGEWIGALLGKPVTVEIVKPAPALMNEEIAMTNPPSMPNENTILDGVPPASDIWAIVAAFTPRARDDRSDIVIPFPARANLRGISGGDAEEGGFFAPQGERIIPEVPPLPGIMMTWNPQRLTVADAEQAELAAILWPEFEIAIAA